MSPSLAFPSHHQRHLHEKGSFVSPDPHLLFLLLIPPPEVRLQSMGPPKASPQQPPASRGAEATGVHREEPL